MVAMILFSPIKCTESYRRTDPKVTDEDVRNIRVMRNICGMSLRAIADAFRISHEMVNRIAKYRCYRNVPDVPVPDKPVEPVKAEPVPIKGFSAAQVNRMKNGVRERNSLRWSDRYV